MLYIDQAIVTRWNAQGLDASISTLWDTQVPEGSTLPYAVMTNISDARFSQTEQSRYQNQMVQFDVYHTSKESCGALMELVDTAFLHANLAKTNPLSVAAPDGIVRVTIDSPYIIEQISDTIWRGMMTISVLYRRAGGL